MLIGGKGGSVGVLDGTSDGALNGALDGTALGLFERVKLGVDDG